MFRHQPKTPNPLSAFPNITNSTTPIYQFRLLEGSGFGVMIVKPLTQMKIGFWFEFSILKDILDIVICQADIQKRRVFLLIERRSALFE